MLERKVLHYHKTTNGCLATMMYISNLWSWSMWKKPTTAKWHKNTIIQMQMSNTVGKWKINQSVPKAFWESKQGQSEKRHSKRSVRLSAWEIKLYHRRQALEVASSCKILQQSTRQVLDKPPGSCSQLACLFTEDSSNAPHNRWWKRANNFYSLNKKTPPEEKLPTGITFKHHEKHWMTEEDNSVMSLFKI